MIFRYGRGFEGARKFRPAFIAPKERRFVATGGARQNPWYEDTHPFVFLISFARGAGEGRDEKENRIRIPRVRLASRVITRGYNPRPASGPNGGTIASYEITDGSEESAFLIPGKCRRRCLSGCTCSACNAAD
jgi:hypothetical protein